MFWAVIRQILWGTFLGINSLHLTSFSSQPSEISVPEWMDFFCKTEKIK